MKISSGEPTASSERAKAWPCLITNLLVLPGLGSLMVKRRVGYAQMLLSLAGFGVTLWYLVRIVLIWAREFQLPDDPSLYRNAILGIVVFLAGWVWSLFTSLAIFRKP
ncbi:MAG: hypothetical protein U1G07_18550 [Verrucomicrobiota bacterium]